MISDEKILQILKEGFECTYLYFNETLGKNARKALENITALRKELNKKSKIIVPGTNREADLKEQIDAEKEKIEEIISEVYRFHDIEVDNFPDPDNFLVSKRPRIMKLFDGFLREIGYGNYVSRVETKKLIDVPGATLTEEAAELRQEELEKSKKLLKKLLAKEK